MKILTAKARIHMSLVDSKPLKYLLPGDEVKVEILNADYAKVVEGLWKGVIIETELLDFSESQRGQGKTAREFVLDRNCAEQVNANVPAPR